MISSRCIEVEGGGPTAAGIITMAAVQVKPGASGGMSPLQMYTDALRRRPVVTKMITNGVFLTVSEIIATNVSGLRPPPVKSTSPLSDVIAVANKAGIDVKAAKMFIYATLINTPLSHVMTSTIQRLFTGRTSLQARVAQIVVYNLTVTLFMNTLTLVCMTYINGVRSADKIRSVVRATFWPVMRLSWSVQPILIAIAQSFLPAELWEPFFAFIRFLMNTYFNTIAKRRLASEDKTQDKPGADGDPAARSNVS